MKNSKLRLNKNIFRRKFEENDYMGTYESQTELYGKRLSVHKDVMHLASIASQVSVILI